MFSVEFALTYYTDRDIKSVKATYLSKPIYMYFWYILYMCVKNIADDLFLYALFVIQK